MSRADEIRAREAARSERRAAETNTKPKTAATAEKRPMAAPKVRAKSVRKTVDLSPHRYSLLTQWCSETAVELGVARITGQDLLNILVGRLLTDETLARKIRDDLADDFRQR